MDFIVNANWPEGGPGFLDINVKLEVGHREDSTGWCRPPPSTNTTATSSLCQGKRPTNCQFTVIPNSGREHRVVIVLNV